MTRDDILKLAAQAELPVWIRTEYADQAVRFADLIAANATIKAAEMLAQGLQEARAAEREACAQACDEQASREPYGHAKCTAALCAQAIRARGN